ncbi:alpha/beta hydrolase [Nocardia brasiliensis]|uniref:alpha/beta hydrolase n=1 Tax=Nocardia brasiliensis TaxID=37326 RepID=UPI0024567EA0|nr:alpha/beta hydrolase family protein [Nocardia brasiliensis]
MFVLVAANMAFPVPLLADFLSSAVVSVQYHDPRRVTLTVHSGAMDRDVLVEVLIAADSEVPRPNLYLLLGVGGGADGATWFSRSDAQEFFAGKNVNVIMPLGGQASYYADWEIDDYRFGRQRWKTFLTEELPPLMDVFLKSNGRNAIAGYSMSATSALALAATTGGLYSSVASYSGCAQISDPIGHEFVRLTLSVERRELVDIERMYGPAGSPRWAENDPYVQAERLRGKSIYISNGSGLPGEFDQLGGKYTLPGLSGFADQLIFGGVIEAGANYCARNMQTRLESLGIPARYNFTAVGTHSWGYWNSALADSWPTLAPPLRV